MEPKNSEITTPEHRLTDDSKPKYYVHDIPIKQGKAKGLGDEDRTCVSVHMEVQIVLQYVEKREFARGRMHHGTLSCKQGMPLVLAVLHID